MPFAGCAASLDLITTLTLLMRSSIFSLSIFVLSLSFFAHSNEKKTGASPKKPMTKTAEEDPHIWLEGIEDEKALSWVKKQNKRTLEKLQSDPRYKDYESAALEVLTSKERIPYGRVRDGMVYNFWQDDEHVRGLWRRTPLDSYAKDEPEWETVLDLDKLSKDEGKNWVYKGVDCFRDDGSGDYVCMVSLSDGGKDAVEKREFDLKTKSFVKDGFFVPEAKQSSDWINRDELLIGTDWGEGSLTESGYPRVLKRWKRGTPLEEAVEVIRGDVEDVAMWPFTGELDDGTVLMGAMEAETFFTATHWWLPDDDELDPVKIPIPPKASLDGIYRDHFLISLKEEWKPEGQGDEFKNGDLVAFEIEPFLKSRKLPKVELVFRPKETQAVNYVAVAKGAALLSINDNVVGKILRLELQDDQWKAISVELPGSGQTGLVFADKDESTVFLNYEDFLTPDSLLQYDPDKGKVTTLKSLSPKFDTTGLKVEQHFVNSTDGTRIPYFVVHREDLELDGSTPTLLYGYGGFQISMRPSYSPTTGRLWLEKGGAYVLANIRGGGEFGPQWHQAGLKQKRQRIYDDFISVAEDVIENGITQPEHLGIMGGSNGGLLMGVMLNQRPDLWNAVVVQVPSAGHDAVSQAVGWCFVGGRIRITRCAGRAEIPRNHFAVSQL